MEIHHMQVKHHLPSNLIYINTNTSHDRFGLPATLISDNGKQFNSQTFTEFCSNLGIKQRFTSVEHPQSNGQTELANRILLGGLKKRLDEAKGRWAEELPSVLWSYRTTTQTATQETPFKLTYGCEAMIPVEIGQQSDRRENYHQGQNNERRKEDLEMLLEIRETAQLRNERHKALIAKAANKKLRAKSFPEGSLVLRLADGPRRIPAEGKLTATWEGPFRVTTNLGNGAYRLESIDGKAIPRTWNGTHLKAYHVQV